MAARIAKKKEITTADLVRAGLAPSPLRASVAHDVTPDDESIPLLVSRETLAIVCSPDVAAAGAHQNLAQRFPLRAFEFAALPVFVDEKRKPGSVALVSMREVSSAS